ncbi:MAG: hypothetical protein R3344_15710 [Acidobacteriota bacterium]|nr:hypothetical protein [Acidobacteriota bacterium]
MKVRLRSLAIPVLLGLFTMGCGDDDPVDPGNGDPAPDLSGTYTLISIVGVVTGGMELGPADGVTGTFTLTQTIAGDPASGTYEVSLVLPGGAFQDEGTYQNELDGFWSQSGNLQQGLGTYAIVANRLTVNVTDPVTASSSSLWQKQ